MKYFYLLFLLTAFNAISQDHLLTAEERAYFFHIVRKSPILENNLGRFIEYRGPEILLRSGQVNYDSTEQVIINQPEMLLIRTDEIAKSPKGLLAEAANKMAIYELNKALRAHSKKEDDDGDIDVARYEEFESILLPHMPPNAFKQKGNEYKLHPKIDNVFNPNLSLDDKKNFLDSYRFLDQADALQIIQAIGFATNQYVEKRTYEIYRALGGIAEEFDNYLIAAGDGSNTSGLLEEREKDEKGRWNKGLPKAVGLFPYQVSIVESLNDKGKATKKIEPARVATYHSLTVGNNRQTNLHFDVWGYNDKKQTTVVVEKDGKCYRLFGAGDTRFLSPDSAFSEGATYQSIINDLQFNKIAKLDDMIYGRRGFDYWIEYNEKKKDDTEMRIEKAEKKYSDYGYTSITTDRRPSRAVRKDKKKSTTLKDYQPTTRSQKDERAKTQSEIVHLYGLFEGYKSKIKELKADKSKALELMGLYQLRLEEYKRNFGLYPVPYKEKDGLYTFEDSTTFDVFTQEFTFPASLDTIPFEVRLLAIPVSSLSDEADEVMLHINKMEAEVKYDARIQLELVDVFESDAYLLKQSLFGPKDSLALRLFFEGLLNKKVDFEIIARGEGIGKREGARIVKNSAPEELKTYPGNTDAERKAAKMDSTFRDLRRTEMYITLNRGVTLEVNSYTDPVHSNVKVDNPDMMEQFTKLGLTENEILSVMRTYSVLVKMKEEINYLAGIYMTRPEAKIVIDRFNKTLSKQRISVKTGSVKLPL